MTLSLLVLVSLITSIITPKIALADAGGSGATVCTAAPMAIGVTDNEKTILYKFGAKLEALRGAYGKPGFEDRLQKIVTSNFPDSITISKVSPTFLQRLQNRVDQERVRDVIAASIGLRNTAWLKFESHMRNVALFGASNGSPYNRFSTAAVELIGEIKKASKKASLNSQPFYNSAVVAIGDMHQQLSLLRLMNAEQLYANFPSVETMDDILRNMRTVATITTAAVGGAILIGTLVYAGPVVAAAGSVGTAIGTSAAISASSLTGYAFSSALWAARLMRVGQIAGGASVGFVGAPAAAALEDSYHTVTEALRLSKANRTTYSCELQKTFAHQWQNFGSHSASASMLGVSFGVGGGIITTLGPKAASALLSTAWISVLTAQGWSVVSMGLKVRESIIYYQLAKMSAEDGDFETAEKIRQLAQKAAQESGDAALQGIIIATLTHHVALHRAHAYHEGEMEIRKLYAASADTIPTAFSSIRQIGGAAIGYINGK